MLPLLLDLDLYHLRIVGHLDLYLEPPLHLHILLPSGLDKVVLVKDLVKYLRLVVHKVGTEADVQNLGHYRCATKWRVHCLSPTINIPTHSILELFERPLLFEGPPHIPPKL